MKHGIGAAHGFGEVGREVKPPAATLPLDQLVEPRLVDRDLGRVQQSGDLSASLSTQTTFWPKSAKQAPDTRPT